MTIVYIGAAIGIAFAVLRLIGVRLRKRQLETAFSVGPDPHGMGRVVEIKRYAPATREQIIDHTGPRR